MTPSEDGRARRPARSRRRRQGGVGATRSRAACERASPPAGHPFLLPAADRRTPLVTGPDWTGLPVRVVGCLTRARALGLLDAERRLQEEYLEWRTVRDRGGAIRRVELTTELRDYWRVLAAHEPARTVELVGRADRPCGRAGGRVRDPRPGGARSGAARAGVRRDDDRPAEPPERRPQRDLLHVAPQQRPATRWWRSSRRPRRRASCATARAGAAAAPSAGEVIPLLRGRGGGRAGERPGDRRAARAARVRAAARRARRPGRRIRAGRGAHPPAHARRLARAARVVRREPRDVRARRHRTAAPATSGSCSRCPPARASPSAISSTRRPSGRSVTARRSPSWWGCGCSCG